MAGNHLTVGELQEGDVFQLATRDEENDGDAFAMLGKGEDSTFVCIQHIDSGVELRCGSKTRVVKWELNHEC